MLPCVFWFDCVTMCLVAKAANIFFSRIFLSYVTDYCRAIHTFINRTIRCRRGTLYCIRCVSFTSSITDSRHSCVVLIWNPWRVRRVINGIIVDCPRTDQLLAGVCTRGTRYSENVSPWKSQYLRWSQYRPYQYRNKNLLITQRTNRANQDENKSK